MKTGRCVASPGVSAYSSNLERARRGRKEGGREDTEVRPRLKCFSLQSHQVHGQQGGLSHGVPPAGTSARAPERLFPNSWQVSLSVYSRPHPPTSGLAGSVSNGPRVPSLSACIAEQPWLVHLPERFRSRSLIAESRHRFGSVQSLSRVPTLCDPHGLQHSQASLSITNSPKLTTKVCCQSC